MRQYWVVVLVRRCHLGVKWPAFPFAVISQPVCGMSHAVMQLISLSLLSTAAEGKRLHINIKDGECWRKVVAVEGEQESVVSDEIWEKLNSGAATAHFALLLHSQATSGHGSWIEAECALTYLTSNSLFEMNLHF